MKECLLQKRKNLKRNDKFVISYHFFREKEREREERKSFRKLRISARLTILGLRCFEHEYFKLLQTTEREEQHNVGNECIMDKEEREEREG